MPTETPIDEHGVPIPQGPVYDSPIHQHIASLGEPVYRAYHNMHLNIEKEAWAPQEDKAAQLCPLEVLFFKDGTSCVKQPTKGGGHKSLFFDRRGDLFYEFKYDLLGATQKELDIAKGDPFGQEAVVIYRKGRPSGSGFDGIGLCGAPGVPMKRMRIQELIQSSPATAAHVAREKVLSLMPREAKESIDLAENISSFVLR